MVIILVTGSRGFIGKNFISKVKSDNRYKIYEFNRGDSLTTLEKYIKVCNFIFHFAGEVRPASSAEEFNLSNVILTEQLIHVLKENGKKTPILYASSIHAQDPKNEYGRTKRKSEVLIEDYSNDFDVSCYIYRLPHLFGELCKPNHNSVITTWIYNIINDLPVTIYDRAIKIEYTYIQDVIVDFMNCLHEQKNEQAYLYPTIVYPTTLGQISDYINEFNANLDNPIHIYEKNTFKSKLHLTFLNCIPRFKHPDSYNKRTGVSRA